MRSVDGQPKCLLGKERLLDVLLDVWFMWPPWHDVDMYPLRHRSRLRTFVDHAARDWWTACGM